MRKLLLTVDHQFVRTPDGKVWVKTIYGYEFWKRYLEVFDEVRIAARLREVASIEEKMLIASGERVEFYPLPQYRGSKEFILRYPSIKNAVKTVTEGCSCAIFRIPSPIANLIKSEVLKAKLPWAVEIVNDPWDNFAPGAFKSIFRPLYRLHFTRQVKKCALEANGVSYVTKEALQKRYPSYARLHGEDEKHFESYYSSIILKKDYIWRERTFPTGENGYTIVHVNSCVTDFSKGHDVVIRVVKELRDRGMNVKAKFIGDGPKRSYFENYAKELGIADYIKFTGLLSSSSDVRDELIDSAILIFPTVGEGLPRTIIEAMAVGLPCLSTPVNGIPELLENEYLFEQQDVHGFSKKAEEILKNRNEYLVATDCNLKKAGEYINTVLQKRRNDFYFKLKIISTE